MPFSPNSGKMNGTLEGTSTSSFQSSRLPQHRGNDQKSCLQRGMSHSQFTLRDLASGPQIAVVLPSWETLCTSQPAIVLQAQIILPSLKRP
ncbi:hypothetical protein AVEN_82484-1 [Araneus ventricosus]|uniref:Uncharacterized protein n=1 Tax=Araneus ventricosus TaxID=182803 RepID=A0A4Y2KU83_ARAVE|nr:hypothetical protein AVEN_82484-1 [Araneus ventricosus]